jgi:hypothetical protein
MNRFSLTRDEQLFADRAMKIANLEILEMGMICLQSMGSLEISVAGTQRWHGGSLLEFS